MPLKKIDFECRLSNWNRTGKSYNSSRYTGWKGRKSIISTSWLDYAEHHILSGEEAGFNLTVFYGKDADWAALMNSCRRYPMFAERQVVILKEAQQMRDIDKLEAYIDKPLASTILAVRL